MRILPLLMIAASACGRIGFDAQLGNDASTDGAQVADASRADAASEFATGPFDSPELIAELSTEFHEDDPTLTGDMLEIYFKSARDGATADDIYGATRASINDPFGEPAIVAELSSASEDNTPEVSFDGLSMMLSSTRDGGSDLYQSTRASRSDAWSIPVRVAELSSAADGDYAAARDGSELHLVMTRIIAGNLDLFRSERASTGDRWGEPILVAELSTPEYQADAVVDERGILIYYTAVAPGDGDNRDIYVAERPGPNDSFGAGAPVADVNSSDIDEDPWISPDLTTLYFVRETAGGTKDMYRATRPLNP